MGPTALYNEGQGVIYNYNGVNLSCLVSSVTPTVNGFVYSVTGDLNDPQWQNGEPYGPFEEVPEAQLSLRAANDQSDLTNDESNSN